jgi:hypothetical protein
MVSSFQTFFSSKKATRIEDDINGTQPAEKRDRELLGDILAE